MNILNFSIILANAALFASAANSNAQNTIETVSADQNNAAKTSLSKRVNNWWSNVSMPSIPSSFSEAKKGTMEIVDSIKNSLNHKTVKDGQTPQVKVERIIACAATSSKTEFVHAVNKYVEESNASDKLDVLFNCPKSNDLIAQLTIEDVKFNGPIPVVLETALRKKLEQFPYGSLQLDLDHALKACVATMKNSDHDNFCNAKQCTITDINNLTNNLSKLDSCGYHFMSDTINTIVNAALSDPIINVDNGLQRAELQRTIMSIANTLPTKIIELGIKANESLFEKTSYNCRTNLKKLLALPLTKLDRQIVESTPASANAKPLGETV